MGSGEKQHPNYPMRSHWGDTPVEIQLMLTNTKGANVESLQLMSGLEEMDSAMSKLCCLSIPKKAPHGLI